MGCDIHIFTESRRNVNSKPIWVNCDNWRINPYFGMDEGERKYKVEEIYDDRNYSLFAILAGVRDYSSGNKPVAEPKGIPEDCSPEVLEEYERWDSDGHTHSWLTLKELRDYAAANTKVKQSGLISESQALNLDLNGTLPDSWCQRTNIPGHVYREWEREQDYLSDIIKPLQERLKDVLHLWDDSRIPEFEDQIRIVFWFDN